MSNKYFFRAKISDEKFRTVLQLFCLDIEAKKVAEFTDLNRVTVNNIYNKLRERIASLCDNESPFRSGETELYDIRPDSGHDVGPMRGQKTASEEGLPVFGVVKQGEKVYTQIIKNCTAKDLVPVMMGGAYQALDLMAYDGVVHYGSKTHYRIEHRYDINARQKQIPVDEQPYFQSASEPYGLVFGSGQVHSSRPGHAYAHSAGSLQIQSQGALRFESQGMGRLHSRPLSYEQSQNKADSIEEFWELCKGRLSKFRGVHRKTFYLHIRECEFRYNHRDSNIYTILLKELRQNKLK